MRAIKRNRGDGSRARFYRARMYHLTARIHYVQLSTILISRTSSSRIDIEPHRVDLPFLLPCRQQLSPPRDVIARMTNAFRVGALFAILRRANSRRFYGPRTREGIKIDKFDKYQRQLNKARRARNGIQWRKRAPREQQRACSMIARETR